MTISAPSRWMLHCVVLLTLLACSKSKKHNPPQHWITIQKLQQLSLKKSIDLQQVLPQLKNPSHLVRVTACRVLGLSKKSQAVAPLGTALRDKSRSVQLEAIFALGRLPFASATKLLVAVAGEKDPARVTAALTALGYQRSDDGLKTIKGLQKSANPLIRQAAYLALGRYNRSELLPLLIAGLKDKAAGVRQSALLGLRRKSEQHFPLAQLVPLLDDRDARVRYTAVEIVGERGLKSAAAHLLKRLADQHLGVRGVALQLLQRLTSQDFPANRQRWRAYLEKQRLLPGKNLPK